MYYDPDHKSVKYKGKVDRSVSGVAYCLYCSWQKMLSTTFSILTINCTGLIVCWTCTIYFFFRNINLILHLNTFSTLIFYKKNMVYKYLNTRLKSIPSGYVLKPVIGQFIFRLDISVSLAAGEVVTWPTGVVLVSSNRKTAFFNSHSLSLTS
jgi:hypothetical protein